MYIHIHIYIYLNIHLCTYIYSHIYTRTHTQTRRFSHGLDSCALPLLGRLLCTLHVKIGERMHIHLWLHPCALLTVSSPRSVTHFLFLSFSDYLALSLACSHFFPIVFYPWTCVSFLHALLLSFSSFSVSFFPSVPSFCSSFFLSLSRSLSFLLSLFPPLSLSSLALTLCVAEPHELPHFVFFPTASGMPRSAGGGGGGVEDKEQIINVTHTPFLIGRGRYVHMRPWKLIH